VKPVLKECGRCKFIKYCSLDCQTADWPKHKPQVCDHVLRSFNPKDASSNKGIDENNEENALENVENGLDHNRLIEDVKNDNIDQDIKIENIDQDFKNENS
jgi:hypothetical protein